VPTDVELAIAAAETGAAIVREMYGSSLARLDKSPGDFATEADLESERAIMRVLRAARTTDGFIRRRGRCDRTVDPVTARSPVDHRPPASVPDDPGSV